MILFILTGVTGVFFASRASRDLEAQVQLLEQTRMSDIHEHRTANERRSGLDFHDIPYVSHILEQALEDPSLENLILAHDVLNTHAYDPCNVRDEIAWAVFIATFEKLMIQREYDLAAWHFFQIDVLQPSNPIFESELVRSSAIRVCLDAGVVIPDGLFDRDLDSRRIANVIPLVTDTVDFLAPPDPQSPWGLSTHRYPVRQRDSSLTNAIEDVRRLALVQGNDRINDH